MEPPEACYLWKQVLYISPILVLLVLCAWGWANNFRRYLPHWRNILAAISISIGALNFLVLLTTFLLPLIHPGAYAPFELFLSVLFTAPVGAILAFSLRGLPRIEAVLASLLTITIWLSNVVFLPGLPHG